MSRIQKTLDEIISIRISRRDFVGSALKVSASAFIAAKASSSFPAFAAESSITKAGFNPFKEIPHANTPGHQIPEGYVADVLMRWGDAVFSDSPEFKPGELSVEAQKKQFGYNNDYIAFMPLQWGEKNSASGLLCVNHEYTIAPLMFSGLTQENYMELQTKEQSEIEMAAHGHSVIEIALDGDRWKPVLASEYNRRMNALDTTFVLSGPAAGSDRLKTSNDDSGTIVTGTFANCSGGITPWGTVLFCEENIDFYFHGPLGEMQESANHKRMGFKDRYYPWGKFFDRFNLEKEPNEPNRFGWVIEYDPYDPEAMPVKRTALGRFKHEAANTALAADGRVAVYCGDDDYNEYLYRFVTTAKFNPEVRGDNMDILDDGVLSVAKFNSDGTMEWIPLIFGQHGLTEAKGFKSQADVMIETRKAADIVGATKMDRPEDVEPNPLTGKVYVVLTKNKKREKTDAANPRANNIHGHILELSPPDFDGKADHGADKFKWNVFLLGGNPEDERAGANFGNGTTKDGWFSCPDNITFDNKGNLWVATDGMGEADKFCDGLYVVATDEKNKAVSRHFLNAPIGAEVTGPMFTPDCSTLFVCIQHPSADDGSSFDNPTTRWPDFKDDMPPRPAILAIRKKDGSSLT